MTSIDGLITGLDTKSIVSQLMKIERLPQTFLAQRRTREEAVSASLGTVRSSVLAIRDLARQIRTPSAFQPLKATSSSDAITVTAGSGRTTGTVQVRVDQTAAAAALYSGTVPSLTTVIASGGSTFSHPPATAVGFDSIKGNGIPIGDLPIMVEVATSAAGISGSPLGTFPVELTDSNNTLSIDVDGTAHTVILEPGSYATWDDLRNGLNVAIAANPQVASALQASIQPTGELRLSTTREGSAASLAITGGTALTALGFAVTGPTTGTDGSVRVGTNGPVTAITDTKAGVAHSLAAASGSVTVTMSGALRTGTVAAAQRSFGTGTLQEVVDTINGAGGLGYTAVAVNVGGGYRLQLTTKETGASSTVDIDRTMFTGLSQPLAVLGTGRDATLAVIGGSGSEYTVTSSTNTFEDLLPGIDVTARRAGTEVITISAEPDRHQVADKVASLVEAVNRTLKTIAAETAYDPRSNQGSTLTGNSAVRRVAQAVTRAVIDPVSEGGIATAGQVGISVNRDGTLSFDKALFLDKMATDPEGVSAVFSEATGGTAPGVLDRLASVADSAVAFGTGYLTTARDSAEQRIEGYTRQMESYEVRMALREAQLRRTYANLETAMSGLNSQSNWLAGQLNGLAPSRNS